MANEIVQEHEEHERLTTAQLAKRAETPQKEAEENAARTAGNANGRTAMFPENETESFRSRWRDTQADFVDSPRESVKKADELVAAIIQRLAEVFSAERERLESNWGEGRDVSTEDLRQALQRYRSFFDRLLSL